MEKETNSIKERLYTDPNLLCPYKPARRKPDLALNLYTYTSMLLTTAQSSYCAHQFWLSWSGTHGASVAYMSPHKTPLGFCTPVCTYITIKKSFSLIHIADWLVLAPRAATQNCVLSSLFSGWSSPPLFITC